MSARKTITFLGMSTYRSAIGSGSVPYRAESFMQAVWYVYVDVGCHHTQQYFSTPVGNL